PRDRPAQDSVDVEILWDDFLATGVYAPLARILDALDRPDSLRQKFPRAVAKGRKNREAILESLTYLRLLKPGKDTPVDGDLELILLHDRKGRIRPHGYELVKALPALFNLSEEELQRGVLLKASAAWMLQSGREE